MRLSDYERFYDQAVDEEGNLIEVAIMDKSEPINLNQAL